MDRVGKELALLEERYKTLCADYETAQKSALDLQDEATDELEASRSPATPRPPSRRRTPAGFPGPFAPAYPGVQNRNPVSAPGQWRPGVCSTLVIDTADWAEQLCIASICADKKLSGIEDMGYGKGYV